MKIKGKEKVSNITAAGIGTIKICAEKWKAQKEASYKSFHLVWDKVKNVLCETLETKSYYVIANAGVILQMT